MMIILLFFSCIIIWLISGLIGGIIYDTKSCHIYIEHGFTKKSTLSYWIVSCILGGIGLYYAIIQK